MCETNCYSSFYNFREFELNVLALCFLSPWRGQCGLDSAVWVFLSLRWQKKSMTPNHLEHKKAPYIGKFSEAHLVKIMLSVLQRS